MATASEIQISIEKAVADRDEEALQALLQRIYEEAESPDKPFDASIQLKPDTASELAQVAVESDAALNWANRISRAKRWIAYQSKTAGGFHGLRIVDEGDSWFQYPLLLEDTIDQLAQDPDKAIFSLSGAGDLLRDMADRREYIAALRQTGAPVLLLSGGGNDILGGGNFERFLLPFQPGKQPGQLLNTALLEAALREVTGAYRRILDDVRQSFPSVQIFGHAYDIPFPKQGGRWIGNPLAAKGIPLDVGRSMVEIILDRFTEALRGFQGEYTNFHLVDLRGKVDRGKLSWFDELHPKNQGYGRAADELRSALATMLRAGTVELASGAVSGAAVPVTRMVPGVPVAGLEAAGRLIVLDPGHGGSPPPNKLGGSSWNNAIGPMGTLEKTLTLDVANRTRALLEAVGHRVVLTRTGDVNLSLADRASVARSQNAAVFVSIHFNASTDHNAQGTETFVHPRRSPNSERLCRSVQRAMVAELGLRDRNFGGIKEGQFGVINGDRHAADTSVVLHEVSFLDRVSEEQNLMTEAYRDRIAGALARGITAHFGTGVESGMVEADSAADEIGDAIELSAMEAGQSLPVFLGMAEGPSAGWVGGHALPGDDGMAANSGSDLARLIAESLARDRTGFADGGANDVNEFAWVEVGRGFVTTSFGRDVEADTGALARVFAGVESSGFDMTRYEARIRGLGLSHFVPAEFLFLGNSNASGGGCAGRNGLPPEDLWDNIVKTARMLDEIRKRLGAPIRILSCYRNEAYNGCVGGERNSLHTQFKAVDWHCDAGSVAQWHQVATEVRGSHSDYLGGIGRYPSRNFIHIDTRGTLADWSG